MNEQDYESLGLTIRRSGKDYAVYRVFLSKDGATVAEELVVDHRNLPSACKLAAEAFRSIGLKLNRHEYSLPEYTNGLKIG